MSLPASFLAAVQSRDFKFTRWLEIEGIPYAYGTHAFSGSFFSARAAESQFLGVKAAFTRVPPIEDSELDTLDGMPRRAGTVDFHLADIDDAPTLWTGVGNITDAQLAADLTAAATSLTYEGDGSAIGSSGTLYIGTETMAFSAHDTGTKTISGLTRAKYRSKAQAFGAGFPIGLAPYTMSQRRCWYYVAAVPHTQSSFSSEEPNKVLRFAGTLTAYRMDDAPGEYVATMQTLERELSDKCFRQFRKLTFDGAGGKISGNDGSDGGGIVPGGAINYYHFRESADFETPGEMFAVRFDDEILRAEKSVFSRADLHAGGLFSTARALHEKGGQEVIVIASGSSQEGLATRFTSATFDGATGIPPMTVAADHPLVVLLQVLLSTGEGTNYPGVGLGRNYDVLPESYGMAIDRDRVDVEAIEQLARDAPDLRVGGVIEEPVSFIDFARALLKPFGYYGTSTLEGIFTVRYLRPPLPDETTRPINNTNRIRRAHPGYDSNLSGPVSSIEYRYGWDIINRNFRRIEVLNVNEADVYTKGRGRKLSYESKLLYSGRDGIPGEPARLQAMDVREALTRRRDFFRVRYARPPPIVNEVVDFSFIDIELGGLVAVTSTTLPDPATGTRGVVDAIAEVVAKRVDEEEKTIDLTLLMTGYQLGDYRFIAPSLEIDWVEDFQSFVAKANAFTEAKDGQTDMELLTFDGSLAPAFAVGDTVRIWSATFDNSEDLDIIGWDAVTRTVELSAPPVTPLAEGQIITDASFGLAGTARTDVYAFMDELHYYFPS